MTIRTALNSSGEASRKAALMSTNVVPQIKVTRTSRTWALSERDIARDALSYGILASPDLLVQQLREMARSREMAKIAGEKPLSEAIKERRATNSFEDVPIHDADLEKIIRAGLEAPSGYNLQPWRFVVVRDREQKKKLRQAAFGQPKVEEASAVIVACGDPDGWKGPNGDLEEMIKLAKDHGVGGEQEHNGARNAVTGFLGSTPGQAGGERPTFDPWANRHTLIALTTM